MKLVNSHNCRPPHTYVMSACGAQQGASAAQVWSRSEYSARFAPSLYLIPSFSQNDRHLYRRVLFSLYDLPFFYFLYMYVCVYDRICICRRGGFWYVKKASEFVSLVCKEDEFRRLAMGGWVELVFVVVMTFC
jgi:hypothetical protein